MKNNKGFISIASLILLGLVILIGVTVEYSSMMRYMSSSVSNHNTQSYYLAEGKIYMALYEDKYYKDQLYNNIAEYFKKYPFSSSPKHIVIDQVDLLGEDSEKNIEIAMLDTEVLKEIKLTAKSNYNNISTKVVAQGKIFNDLFYLEQAILDKSFLHTYSTEKFEEFLQVLYQNISLDFYKNDSNIYYKEILDYGTLYIDNMGAYKKIDKKLQEISTWSDSFTNTEIMIIAKSDEETGNIVIGENSSNIIKLAGILFIDGNLIVKSNFEFNGLLILKNGSIYIEDDANFKFRGLVVGDNIISYDFMEKTDIIYSRDYLYKYCVYIPGIIDIDIDLIKSE